MSAKRKREILTLFWYSQRPIFEQERGVTMNSARYREALREKLTLAIWSRQRV
jgi:hypothetical protein